MMGRAVARALAVERREVAIGHFNATRRTLIGLIAFVTTAFWAGVFYFGSWAIGIPIETAWFIGLLVIVFLLLLLGLSMGAIASKQISDHDADRTPRG